MFIEGWKYAHSEAMNKIANIENVVCSVETKARHPEVFHYTKPEAFEGIIDRKRFGVRTIA